MKITAEVFCDIIAGNGDKHPLARQCIRETMKYNPDTNMLEFDLVAAEKLANRIEREYDEWDSPAYNDFWKGKR